MKKRFLALLLGMLMLLGTFSLYTVATEADDSDLAYYSEGFEDFTTDMTGEAIKTKLGWTDWDLTVANLKIVEVGGDKKLQIIPLVANGTTSATLVDSIATTSAFYLDMELTPVKADSISPEGTVMAVNDSSALTMALQFPITGEGGENMIRQGLAITGRQVKQVVKNGTTTYNNHNSWNTWYNTRMGKPYGELNVNSDKSIKYGTAGSANNYLFHDAANADGLSFIYRIVIDPLSTASSFRSYVSANGTGATTNEFLKTNVSAASAEDTDMVNAVNGFVSNASFTGSCTAKLHYKDSGVSFYVDDILISKVEASEPITIKVNGEDYTTVAGAELAISTLAAEFDGVLLAIVTDANNVETVYGLNDSIIAQAGMSVKIYSIDLTASKAELRTDDPTGIRWVTKISKSSVEQLNELKAKGMIKSVEIGTVITPFAYANKVQSYEMSKLDTLDSNYPYVQAFATWGTWYETGDTSYSFAGSVVKIRSAHYAMDYIGAGYVTVTLADGSETTVYSNCTQEDSMANVTALAQAVIADANNGLDTAVLAEIQKYVPAT